MKIEGTEEEIEFIKNCIGAHFVWYECEDGDDCIGHEILKELETQTDA